MLRAGTVPRWERKGPLVAEQAPPGKPPQKKPGISPGFWWLIFLGLIAWNVYLFTPHETPEISIPYSAFLDQVGRDNVSEVKIQGDRISGKFVAPYHPPSDESHPVTASGSASPSSPESGTEPSPRPSAAQSSPPQPSAQPATGPSPQPSAQPPSPQPPPPQPSASSKQPATPSRGGTGSATAGGRTYTEFDTLFPAVVGDPRLLPLLETHGVRIRVAEPSNPWFVRLLVDWMPMVLLVGYLFWMAKQMRQQRGGVLGFGRTRAKRYAAESPGVTFDDVAGANEAKDDLREIVEFLRQPAKYHDLGARIPRGILLIGPPGTGKTLLARAVAGEASVPFFSISASEFVEMFVGVGASRVRDLFDQAKAVSPAIVFIDELDAVGRRRGAGLGAVNDEREQTLNQLLVAMDGFDERHEVIVLAATNRPDVLDPALQRPGRFARQVIVALPDRAGREGILRIHTRGLPLGDDVDLGLVARSSIGMSGADLANLCNEAALIAAKLDHSRIAMHDFEEALDKIALGQARPALVDERERRVVAYHEAGHALVAWLTPRADPVHKVTIIRRGRALGVTEQLPEDDRYNYSRNDLLARIDVMLGGRVSEQIRFGDVTTGAENDLVQATRLVRRMVTRWGMGSLGQVAFETDEQQPFLGYQLSQVREYSEATAARIDEEVRRIVEQRRAIVADLLSASRQQLDALAEALLSEETIDQQALTTLLGPRAEAGHPAEPTESAPRRS